MRSAAASEYLDLVTRLTHRVRAEHPTAGLWEAADMQWWWRSERSSDQIAQQFWLDDGGEPEAAIILTDWGRTWGCDPIVLPSRAEALLPALWSEALQRMDDLSLPSVEILVGDDDDTLRDLVVASGFEPSGETDITTWMPAIDHPEVAPIAEGFRLHDRLRSPDRPHHMIPRSGERVAERLSETSLYRPDLDLWVEDPAGEVASYGLFWWDPSTGVGLVEPMRTEERFWRLGLGRHVLTTGLDRLAALGATRLKVSYVTDNPAAERLYLTAGFRPGSTSTVFRR